RLGQTRSFGDVGSMSGLPESGRPSALSQCRTSARKRHMHHSKTAAYSITSLAMTSRDGGTSATHACGSRPHVKLDPHFQQIFAPTETLRAPWTSLRFRKLEDSPAAQMLVPVRSTQRDRGG